MTELATGEFSLMSGTIDSYNENMVRLSKSHEDFDAKLKSLTTTTENYKTASEFLAAQEKGMGTQLDILSEQNKGLEGTYGGLIVSIESTVAQVKNFSTETKSAQTSSKELTTLLGKAQEAFALIGMSAKDAAIQKELFAAKDKGASEEQLKWLFATQTAINDNAQVVKDAKKSETKAISDATAEAKRLHTEMVNAKKKANDEEYAEFEKDTNRELELTKKLEQAMLDNYAAVRRELDPTIAQYEEYGRKVAAVEEMASAGGISQAQRMQDIIKLQENLNKGVDQAINKNNILYTSAEDIAKNTLKRLDDAFSQTWKNLLSGSQDIGSALKSWFVNLLAELAHQAITKPIMISIGTSMGLLGVNGTASAAGGVATSASGSFLGSTVTGIGSIGSGVSAGFGSAMSMNFAGSNIATSAMWNAGSYGMAVGNAVATYVPYIAAAIALDKITGGAVSAGIMGGSRDERARAIGIGYATDTGAYSTQTSASHYDAGWGRSGDWVTSETLNAQAQSAINSTIDAMATSIKSNAEKLGYAFNDGLSINLSENTLGKTAEETTSIITKMMGDIGTQLVKGTHDAFGGSLADIVSSMSKTGEDLGTTFNRVISEFDTFNQPIGRLNDSLSVLSPTTLQAVDSLVQLYGGIGNLTAANNNFINAFYTSAQKTELTTQTVISMFDTLGLSIPPSSAALVDMVKGLDLNTEAGRKAYATITSGTSVLTNYYGTIKSASDALTKTINDIKTSVTSLQKQATSVVTKSTAAVATSVPNSDSITALLGYSPKTLDQYYSTINTLSATIDNLPSLTEAVSKLYAKYNAPVSDTMDAFNGILEGNKKLAALNGTDSIEAKVVVDMTAMSSTVQSYFDTLAAKTKLETILGSESVITDYINKINTNVTSDVATGVTTSVPDTTITPTTNTTNTTDTVKAIETLQEAYARLKTVVQSNDSIAQQRLTLEDEIKNFGKTELELRAESLKSMDSYNAGLQKTLWALQDGAEAAAKTQSLNDTIAQLTDETAYNLTIRERELSALSKSDKALQKRIYSLQDEAVATQKENELANVRKNMQSTLTDLVDSEGAITRARQAELSTMDASLRGIQQSIYAITDAKNGLSTAQSDLVAATNTEKQAIADRFNKYKTDLQDQSNLRIEALQKESTTASDAVNKLKSLQSALKGVSDAITPKYTNSATDMQRATSEIMGYVNQGIVPAQEDVQAALDRVKTQDATYYSDEISYARDQAIANNATTALLKLVNKNTDGQETTLTNINNSIKSEQDSIKDGLLKLDDEAKIQNAKLDEQLTVFGLGTAATLSVKAAIDNLNSAILTLANAKTASSALQPVSSVTNSNGTVTTTQQSLDGQHTAIYTTPLINGGYGSSTSGDMLSTATSPIMPKTTNNANGTVTIFASNGAFSATPENLNYTGTNKELADNVAAYKSIMGFSMGGYTGNAGTNEIAGVVHGQEYVINASTTKDLGLNDGNGGVFKAVLAEIKALRDENIQLQIQLLTESRKQTRLAEKADIDGLKVEVMA
jgi:hypothetical protein